MDNVKKSVTKEWCVDIGERAEFSTSFATDFWWTAVDRGPLLGTRKVYHLCGLQWTVYPKVRAVTLHLFWLKLQFNWILKDSD